MTKPGRRLAASLVAVCALGVAAGFVARGFVSPYQEEARAAPPPRALLTAPVAHRVFRVSVVFRASVAEADPVGVPVPSSVGGDRPVVTAMGVRAGEPVHDGMLLAAVAGRPILILAGPLPAYRSMAPGDSGPDVAELQSALELLGYRSAAEDQSGSFGYGTAQAVAAWYAASGYQPVDAPPDASSLLAEANRAVATAQTRVDNAEAKGGPPLLAADERLNAAERAVTHVEETTGASVPMGEVVFVPHLPVTTLRVAGGVGALLGGSADVLTLGSGQVVVSGGVDSSEVADIRAGQSARIESDIDNTSFPATVAFVASSPSNSSTGPTYAVRVTPTEGLAGIVGQNVGVSVRTASSGRRTWVVPVAAVTTSADGITSVTVAGRDGAQRVVPVGEGLSSNGLVAVDPTHGGLANGDRVVLGVASSGSGT